VPAFDAPATGVDGNENGGATAMASAGPSAMPGAGPYRNGFGEQSRAARFPAVKTRTLTGIVSPESGLHRTGVLDAFQKPLLGCVS
jgi:hypothetical protein